MSTKHVFESPQGLVVKSLRGAVALNPSLRLHAPSKTVYHTTPPSKRQVALISGGGAGHEPAHAGYTGQGMLTASVSGDIFASPSAKQIVTAITLALYGQDGGGGEGEKREALVVINNYTGDRLNFGLAMEKVRVMVPGLDVRAVVVSDDVSLLKAANPSLIGARGLGGNIFVCKVLGALAERGAGVGAIERVGNAVVGRLGSIGVGMEHCHVPGRKESGKGEEGLGEGECEIGMGLHNEPGARKVAVEGAETLVREMLEGIYGSREGGFVTIDTEIGESDEVILYVNNLGGVSQLEMGAVVDETLIQLEEKKIFPTRVYCAPFMTSLNMPGFSISLLNLSGVYRDLAAGEEADTDVDILQLLDDPTSATAWAGVSQFWGAEPRRRKEEEAETELLVDSLGYMLSSDAIEGGEERGPGGGDWWRVADVSPGRVRRAVERACTEVLQREGEMTRYDTVVGDGDCGETFAAGAKALLKAMEDGQLNVANMDPAALARRVGEVLEDHMGGTIGALFAIYFTALSAALSSSDTTSVLTIAPLTALESLSKYTPARPGDRTALDALHPFAHALAEGKGLKAAARAAQEGASRTEGMTARLGRAVYVGGAEEDKGTKEGEGRGLPPDPGAWGVAAILEGFWAGYNE